jgi:hypothetical protein
LNDLQLWTADIGNAYLEAETNEKLFIVAGPEFEDLEGHVLVFQKALYGLRSSGLKWSQRLHDILLDLGYTSSKADSYVWYKECTKTNKYEYITVYVDDLLIASDAPEEILKTLRGKFSLKIKGDKPIAYHLGCDYLNDPDGTLVAMPKKYISKILDAYVKMFGEQFQAYKTPLE